MLVDSGMGLRPLKPEIAALAERPVAAICTHCHFDHIGCAHEFDTRLGHRIEDADYTTPSLDRSCAGNWIGAELLTALPHEGYEPYRRRRHPRHRRPGLQRPPPAGSFAWIDRALRARHAHPVQRRRHL
ncbi:MAG: MBL fold metallo-hydrolase [Alphaproteobacteria bacterium]|nr:MBL fold metallo-hydrolase [Alphaproteobacteria bacterium]